MFESINIRQQWWFDFALGLVILGFGLYCFSRPDLAILTLGRIFGIFLFIFGVLYGITSMKGRFNNQYWSASFFEGLLYIVFSIILLLSPESVLVLNRIIGLWFLTVGFFRFLLSRLHSILSRYTLTGDALLILFGLFLLVYPKIFAGLVAAILGVLFIMIGLLMIGNGIAVWKAGRRLY